MHASRSHDIRFDAPDEGIAPLTWGQLNIWFPLQEFGDESANYNLQRIVECEPGLTEEEALTCVRTLVESHQALRTTVRRVDGRDPEQQVHAAGTFPVHLHEAPPEEITSRATAVVDAAASRPFDLASEFPGRFHCVVVDGLVRAVGFVVSHVAVDGGGMHILARRLGGLLRGQPEPAPAPRWEPLDQAAHERSARGRRQEERAVAYWRKQLAGAPSTVRRGLPGPATGEDRYHKVRIESRAMAAAVERIAGRSGTSTSSVLLAAACLTLKTVTDRDTVALKVIAQNRHTPRGTDLVSCCAQDALFVVDAVGRAGEDFDALAQRVRSLSTASFFHAQYDPRTMKRLLREFDTADGGGVDLSCYFNDSRATMNWTEFQDRPMTPRDLDDLRSETRLKHVMTRSKDDMTFLFHVREDRTTCNADISAHARLLSPEESGAFLLGLEAALCRISLGESGVADLKPANVVPLHDARP